MSAISRNRTRNDARNVRTWRVIRSFECQPDLLHRLVGPALPFRNGVVADVLQVLHPHLRRPEPARGEVAEAVEEGDAVLHLGLRLLRPGDVVEDGGPLAVRAIEERLVVAPRAFVIEPGEPAAH